MFIVNDSNHNLGRRGINFFLILVIDYIVSLLGIEEYLFFSVFPINTCTIHVEEIKNVCSRLNCDHNLLNWYHLVMLPLISYEVKSHN